MANNHPNLKRVGPYWHYHLKVNGERLHGSTRAKDLPTAKKVLDEKRKDLLSGQLGIVTKMPTLAALTKDWLKSHQGTFSPKHLRGVEQLARLWILPQVGTTRIDRIGSPEALKIRMKLIEAGKSHTTANNALKALKLLLNHAVRLQLLDRLPRLTKPLRVQRKPRPTVPASRVQEFLKAMDRAARNPHVAVMVRVMVGLGMRESEVLGMRWEWFNPDQRTYTVGKAKGKEARVLAVPSWLWESIHTMPRILNEWVFPAEDGKPHRPQFCKKAIQRVTTALGLGHVTAHRLRASFATLHAEAGTPISEIQGFLGHKAVTTTMLYVEQTLEGRRRAQDTLSKQLGFA